MVGDTERREIRQLPLLLQLQAIHPRQAKEQDSCIGPVKQKGKKLKSRSVLEGID